MFSYSDYLSLAILSLQRSIFDEIKVCNIDLLSRDFEASLFDHSIFRVPPRLSVNYQEHGTIFINQVVLGV